MPDPEEYPSGACAGAGGRGPDTTERGSVDDEPPQPSTPSFVMIGDGAESCQDGVCALPEG